MASAAEVKTGHNLEGTVVERINNMREAIEAGADEAQQLRHLPSWLTDQMVKENIFLFACPPEYGGEDATVQETIDVLEATAAIDGSVGWNVMIGSEINAMAAGGLPEERVKEVFLDNPGVIMCGGGGPGTSATPHAKKVDGGYKVWAETSFMSGCHNSTWAFQNAPLVNDDGEPILDENGMPSMHMWFINKEEFEIQDTWNMASLRGSGSHHVKSDGAFVPDRHEPVQLMLPARHPNPVYRIPVSMRLSYNKVGTALGVARGAIDSFIDLAQNKPPLMSASTLKDKPLAQYRLGEAEATVRACRAYVMETMTAITDELTWSLDGPAQPSWETTQNARLACTHGAQACLRAVDLIHNTSGTSGLRMDNPLERKLRDAHGCAAHRWVSPALYEELGATLFGAEPGMGLL